MENDPIALLQRRLKVLEAENASLRRHLDEYRDLLARCMEQGLSAYGHDVDVEIKQHESTT